MGAGTWWWRHVAQNSCSDGEAQNSCLDGEAQNSCSDGEAQNSCLDGEAQNSCSDGEAQNSCSDGEAQNSCSDGEAQNSCSDGKRPALKSGLPGLCVFELNRTIINSAVFVFFSFFFDRCCNVACFFKPVLHALYSYHLWLTVPSMNSCFVNNNSKKIRCSLERAYFCADTSMLS